MAKQQYVTIDEQWVPLGGPPGSPADIAAHEAAPDPHPQYLTDADASTALAAKEDVGTAADLVTAHEAEPDPHPGYLTQSEADALYTAAGVTSGSLILSGTATPTAGTGATGDYYLDTDDRVLYGPKVASGQAVYTSQTPTDSWNLNNEGYGINVASEFTLAKAGTITALRLNRKSTSFTGYILTLWSAGGAQLASATVPTGGATGWTTVPITAVAVTAGQVVRLSLTVASGQVVSLHRDGFASGITNGDVTMAAMGYLDYSSTPVNPTSQNPNHYYVDLVFASDPWPVALYGPAGQSTILSGTATPIGATGAVGDYYLDTDDRILYGPKVAAVGGFGPPQSVYTSQSHTEQPALGDWCMGNDFVFAVGGRITGLRFNSNYTTYQDKSLSVWTTGGVLLGTVIPVAAGVVGWQSGMFATPIAITAGQTVRVVLNAPVVGLLRRAPNFASDIVNGDVTMLKQAYYVAMPDTTPVFPTTPGTSTYFSDVIFEAGTAPNNPWPVALKSVPPGGTTSQVLAKTSATDYAAGWTAPSDPAAAITAHEAATNPHPVYLTQAEGDALYGGGGLQTRATASVTTASLAAGAGESTTVTLAPSYRLMQLTASRPARVRLYTTAAKRDADISRPIGTDPYGNHGVIFDFFAPNTSVMDLSPVVDGFDGDAPPDGTISARIENMDTVAGTVEATFVWIKMET